MAGTAVKPSHTVLGFDERFGQRMAGDPPYRGDDTSEDFTDSRFGGLVNESRESLRQSLGTLIGENDAEVNAILRRAGIENPNEPKRFNLPGGLIGTVVRRNDGSFACHVQMPDGTRRRFVSKRDAESAATLAAKKLQEVTIRDLTPSEEIEIARLCACGQRQEGGARYLRYRIGQERADKYDNPEKMIADPSLQPVFSECAMFCWLNSRPDVRDSAEFQDFVADYAGSRPLTFQLLDEAAKAFGPHQEKGQARAAAERFRHSEPLPDERSLNDMSDEEVSRQFWQTARYVARGGR